MIDPTELTGKTVLVSGGAGFIGSHIADALVANNTVRVLDDLSTGSRAFVPDGATLFEGELTTDEIRDAAMDGVDLVFHEAAVVSVQDSVDQPSRTNQVNIDGTLDLLESARHENARVVLASSAAIYGQPDSVPIAESHPKRPTSPYGLSKLAADHYARLYCDLYDLPTVTLRYFNVYGPRQNGEGYGGVIASFVENALTDTPLTIEGDGEQTRDFVHVDDVVRANLAAATTAHTGRAYNVGTGETVSIRELAGLVRAAARTGVPIRECAARSGDVRHSRADPSRAEEDLGFEASISLAEGLSTLPGLRR